MIDLNFSTFINRPVTQVFDFISTTKNDVHWQYGALASNQTSKGSIGAGTLFESLGHFLGRRVQSNFEITEYEPNRKYGYKSVTGPIEIRTSYTFEIIQGGTCVTASTQLHQNNFFKVPDAIVAISAKKQFKENLANLKSLLEV